MESRHRRSAVIVILMVALIAAFVFAGPVVQLNAGLIGKGPPATRGAGSLIADTQSAVLWTRVMAAVIFALLGFMLLRAKKRVDRYRS